MIRRERKRGERSQQRGRGKQERREEENRGEEEERSETNLDVHPRQRVDLRTCRLREQGSELLIVGVRPSLPSLTPTSRSLRFFSPSSSRSRSILLDIVVLILPVVVVSLNGDGRSFGVLSRSRKSEKSSQLFSSSSRVLGGDRGGVRYNGDVRFFGTDHR